MNNNANLNARNDFYEYCTEVHDDRGGYFACYGSSTSQYPNEIINDITYKKLQEENTKGNDIYNVVQPSSGFTDSEVKSCTFCFADWDVGRQENGDYYPLSYVYNKKQDKVEEFNSLDIPPTLIVETRNGFQIYWKFNLNGEVLITDSHKYRTLQQRISERMESDSSVINPARVLRVPGFYWLKKKEGLEPFMTRLLKCDNKISYTHDQILKYFFPDGDFDYSSYQNKKKRVNSSPSMGTGRASSGSYWVVFTGRSDSPIEVSAFWENGQLHAACPFCEDLKGHDIVFRGDLVYCNRCRRGGKWFNHKEQIFKYKRDTHWSNISKAQAVADINILSAEDIIFLEAYLKYKGICKTSKEYIEVKKIKVWD